MSSEITQEGYILGIPPQGGQLASGETGEHLMRASRGARRLYDLTNKNLGKIEGYPIGVHALYDPISLFGGDRRKKIAADTRVIQPGHALNTAMILEYLRENGVDNEAFVAGSSLAQIIAMGAEGVMSWDVVLRLARDRGEVMWKVAQEVGGTVALATYEGDLAKKIAEAGAAVQSFQITVVNAANKYVLGGVSRQLESLQASLPDVKIREYLEATLSHHPLMGPAQNQFNRIMKGFKFRMKDPAHPILDDVTNTLKLTSTDILKGLTTHLVTPINWQKNVETLKAARLPVIEIGKIMGNLSGPDSGVPFVGASNWEQIQEVIGRFGTPKVSVVVP